MTENVDVSIVIPTHNRPELLLKAVNSALSALPPGGELIVTDDESEPPASETLVGIDHPSLFVTRNPGKSGAAANRNHGVRKATGKIIFFLDDDDLLFPGYVKRVLSALKKKPEAAWGFSATASHTDTAIDPIEPEGGGDLILKGSGKIKSRIAGLGCGLWVRRSIFEDVGGINEELSINEDTDFCLTLLSNGHAPYYSPNPGVSLYLRKRPTLTARSAASERARCFEVILERHKDFLSAHSDGHAHLLRRYLKYAARARLVKEGMKASVTSGLIHTRAANLSVFLGHVLSDYVRGK